MRIAVRYTLLGLLVFVLVACAAMGLYAHANRFVAPQARHPPAPLAEVAPAPDDLQWHAYGGDDGQTRHAGIRQIDRGNVGHLREAWTYRTGELARRDRWGREGKFQATPIIAGGSLVLCTPFGRVIALDRGNVSSGGNTSGFPPLAPYLRDHNSAARIAGGRRAYARLNVSSINQLSTMLIRSSAANHLALAG